MQTYTEEIETAMRGYYESLNERDRRRYAGIEAFKLGHGGQNYISKILGCSRKTVRKGAAEVTGLPMRTIQESIGKVPSAFPGIRMVGGGAKAVLDF